MYKQLVLPYFLLHNNSTLGENYKCLMYKYKLSHNDWYLDDNNICCKIQPNSVLNEETQANI